MDSTAKFMWLLLPKIRQAVPEGSAGAPKPSLCCTELSSLQLLKPRSRAVPPAGAGRAAAMPMPALPKRGVSVSRLSGWGHILVPANTCTSTSAQGMVSRRGSRASLWGCSYRIKHSLARFGTAVTDGICMWGCGGMCWYMPISWNEAVLQCIRGRFHKEKLSFIKKGQ